MIRGFLGFFLLIKFEWIYGNEIAFGNNAESDAPVSFGTHNSNNPVRRRTYASPSSIKSLPQPPIALIRGSAQYLYPQNGETFNKVFDTPVQTIQAVGPFSKDRYSNQKEEIQVDRREDRRDMFIKIREIEFNRRKKIAEQQQHKLEQRLQLSQQKKLQNRDKIHSERKRDNSMERTIDAYGWASAFTDVLLNGFNQGHGGLFSGHGGYLGNHGSHFGDHGNLFNGHKRKKRKKKKPGDGSNFGNHGNPWGGFGGHHGSQDSIGISAGIQQFFGGGNEFYEVTENIDEHIPQGIFSWQHLLKDSDKIQNKIAPRSNY